MTLLGANARWGLAKYPPRTSIKKLKKKLQKSRSLRCLKYFSPNCWYSAEYKKIYNKDYLKEYLFQAVTLLSILGATSRIIMLFENRPKKTNSLRFSTTVRRILELGEVLALLNLVEVLAPPNWS